MIEKNVMKALMLALPRTNAIAPEWMRCIHVFDNVALAMDGAIMHVARLDARLDNWYSIPADVCAEFGHVNIFHASNSARAPQEKIRPLLEYFKVPAIPPVNPGRLAVSGKYLATAQRAVQLVTRTKTLPILSTLACGKHVWSNGKFAVLIMPLSDRLPAELKAIND